MGYPKGSLTLCRTLQSMYSFILWRALPEVPTSFLIVGWKTRQFYPSHLSWNPNPCHHLKTFLPYRVVGEEKKARAIGEQDVLPRSKPFRSKSVNCIACTHPQLTLFDSDVAVQVTCRLYGA